MIRAATSADLETMVELRRGYCQDDHLDFEFESARAVTARLLREPQWGRVLLCERDKQAIGYVALCVGFSLELGGNEAFIDELFVVPAQRGRGVARGLVKAAVAVAEEIGIKALHLEVDRSNSAAAALYRALGFVARDRYALMTLRI